MKKLTIKKGEVLPSKKEVETFQQLNSIMLPEQFIEFLMTQNPIYVMECKYIVKDREPYDVAFFPFSQKSEEWTVQKAFNNLKEFFEGKYLPFGSDSGGWQYVISIQEKDFGKIYFCRMDEEFPKALTLLANSFDDFINSLEKESSV